MTQGKIDVTGFADAEWILYTDLFRENEHFKVTKIFAYHFLCFCLWALPLIAEPFLQPLFMF